MHERRIEHWRLICRACGDAAAVTNERRFCACGRSSARPTPDGGVLVAGPGLAVVGRTEAGPWEIARGDRVTRPRGVVA
ncbi:MAG TPA: hypothetical protein VF036_02900 [Actinomycetota bacterium]